jgi:hypothetical protein
MPKIKRSYLPADRYYFDRGECSIKNQFAQLNTWQDASYYGQWVNPFKRIFVSYIEGTITRIYCYTDKEFIEELELINQFEKENGNNNLKIDCLRNNDLINKFKELKLEYYLH